MLFRSHCAPVSTQKASVQNNCRLAYRQLSSRDGTYIIQCHANLTLSINFNLIQYHNLNPYPYHTFLQFPSISQIPTTQLLSSTLLSTSLTEYYLTLSHHNQNNTSQDNIYNISNSFYTKIIVFERHPIACFV